MSEQSMEKALEANLKTLGDHLETTLEKWREADLTERTKMDETIKALEDEIGTVKAQLTEERSFHLPGVAVAGEAEEGFSLGKACRAIATQNWDDAGYEKEVFANTQAKAMSQSTDTAGGFIVPEEAITRVIEKLKSRVVAYELGAMDMAATGVPLVLPRVSTAATAYWVAENSTITASDVAFEQLSLTPKTAAGRVVLSNLLLETSNPAADTIIEEDLASQLGLAVDSAALIGGGTGEPVGIISTTGVGDVASTVTSSAITSLGSLLEFLDDLSTNNAYRGRLGWAIHPMILSYIRSMTVDYDSGTQIPLTAQASPEGFQSSILGHPYAMSTQLGTPSSSSGTNSMIFGNWEDLMIARWGGLRLLASNTSDDAFSKDQMHIRGTIRVDVGLRHVESFSYASS